MKSVKLSILVEEIILSAINFAKEKGYEYITPEHVVLLLTNNIQFEKAFINAGGDIDKLRNDLNLYLEDNITKLKDEDFEPKGSLSFNELIINASIRAEASGKDEVEVPHLVDGIISLQDNFGAYFILSQVEWSSFLYELCEELPTKDYVNYEDEKEIDLEESWKSFATLINEDLEKRPPLIGREKELERTMQILCRKYKNNPIHIGEAGVGKTAIIYGLANLINEDKVPEKLKNAHIFSIDLGGLLAGTQYRGDFEKRFKLVMEEISKYDNPIVYIDEIHNIVGAGAINGGSFDISNMLKPYLSDGEIRIIGATTYDEFNKHLGKNKSLLRRFQNIDIKEPSFEECVKILSGLKRYYEDFHNIKYTKGTLEYAITLSSKYISDRYLPDKAIDLIDEAGAYRVMHPLKKKVQTVDKGLIEDVISKNLNIPKKTVEVDEVEKLKELENKLSQEVFGQKEGIDEIVKAIKMSRAGLNDDDKPIANLLFVGPTGVGKTEIAKTLAKELDVKLIRFDMSEYVEKHTVAKLIGAPAGYVGYEEGGLLTDEVKKNPHCILLLDYLYNSYNIKLNYVISIIKIREYKG